MIIDLAFDRDGSTFVENPIIFPLEIQLNLIIIFNYYYKFNYVLLCQLNLTIFYLFRAVYVCTYVQYSHTQHFTIYFCSNFRSFKYPGKITIQQLPVQAAYIYKRMYL